MHHVPDTLLVNGNTKMTKRLAVLQRGKDAHIGNNKLPYGGGKYNPKYDSDVNRGTVEDSSLARLAIWKALTKEVTLKDKFFSPG